MVMVFCIPVGGWVDKYKAVSNGYEELFEIDLDNDGRAGIPVAIDVDADGFVDGLGHYRLMANGSSIDLKDQRGWRLSSRSSVFGMQWMQSPSRRSEFGL